MSESLQSVGAAHAAALIAMIEALECDYERLEELRDTDPEDLTDEDRDELAELEAAAGDCADREDAEQRIMEDPLCVEFSGKWGAGEEPTADTVIVLLATGGPAARIVADYEKDRGVSRARLEVQDWGTPWTQNCDIDSDTLCAYLSVLGLDY